MQSGYEIVIADTSCFILLEKLNELELLKILFSYVITTPFGNPLPEWVKIRSVKNVVFQMSLDIDPGEASAIALAIESEPSVIILDDAKGRKLARKSNLKYTGTLGVLLKAKRAGIISALRPILDKIQVSDFRYSEDVFKEILFLAQE